MNTNGLERFFREHLKAALGFSGGADSSFLLFFATRMGVDIVPFFVKTPFQPGFELDDALGVAKLSGVALRVIEMDVLDVSSIVRNEPDRCYHCKKAIFSRLEEVAGAAGYDLLIDGTNASDDEGDRPGMRSLAELGVLSPLKLCGLTKDDVRRLSREAGLFTHDKPSYSCLATRIPVGEKITGDQLAAIEGAESFLFSLGFLDFRVRLAGRRGKIQLREQDMSKLITRREEIVEKFEALGLESVVLDLRARESSS